MEHAEAKNCIKRRESTMPPMQSAWSTLRQRAIMPSGARRCLQDAIRMEHAEAKESIYGSALIRSDAIRMEHAEAKFRNNGALRLGIMQSAWSTLRQRNIEHQSISFAVQMQSAWSKLRQRPSRDTTTPLPGNATRMQRGGAKSPPILIFTFSFNEHRNQKQLPRKPNKIKGFRGSFEPRLAGFEPTIFRVGVEQSEARNPLCHKGLRASLLAL